MMHIGIDTRLTAYRTGGISTYMRRLVAALETLDTTNRYTIFHSRKAPESFPRFSTAPLWTPCHHRWERWALSLELARFRLNLFHSPDFIPPLHGAKHHVITVHDLTFLHYPQFLTADSRRYYNDQIAAAVRQADHIFAVSETTQNDLVAMLNTPADKITVTPNGVDEQFRPLSPEEQTVARAALGLPSEYILCVGTLEPRKNIIGLLRAYQQLPAAPPLVLVGKMGWQFDDTLAQIRAMHFGERLIWRDDISDAQLPAVYACASVLVLPSFYEGFGMPALEAMACGTVPVVSNRSSLPEVVGAVGAQFNPDDAESIAAVLSHALSDTVWREQMQAAGLARAAQFTWQRTAQLTLSVYNRYAG